MKEKNHFKQSIGKDPSAWPDLIPSYRWSLRMALLIFLILPLVLLVRKYRIINNLDHTITIVDPVGAIETDLRIDHFIDAIWLNNEEILVMGASGPAEQFEIFSLVSKRWTPLKLNGQSLGDHCLEDNFSHLDAELRWHPSGDLIVMALCQKPAKSNVRPPPASMLIVALEIKQVDIPDSPQLSLGREITYSPRLNLGKENSTLLYPYQTVSVSSDYSTIFYGSAGSIWATSPTSVKPQPISEAHSFSINNKSRATWSADGDRVLLSGQRKYEPYSPTDGIYIFSTKTLASQRVLYKAQPYSAATWINEETELFFSGSFRRQVGAWIINSHSKQIWFYNTESQYGIPPRHFRNDASSGLSPDETRFFSIETIYAKNRTENNQRKLKIVEFPKRTDVTEAGSRRLLKSDVESRVYPTPVFIREPSLKFSNIGLVPHTVLARNETLNDLIDHAAWLTDDQVLVIIEDQDYALRPNVHLFFYLYDIPSNTMSELTFPDKLCEKDEESAPITRMQIRFLRRNEDGLLNLFATCGHPGNSINKNYETYQISIKQDQIKLTKVETSIDRGPSYDRDIPASLQRDSWIYPLKNENELFLTGSTNVDGSRLYGAWLVNAETSNFRLVTLLNPDQVGQTKAVVSPTKQRIFLSQPDPENSSQIIQILELEH